jgi:hypothetical protein
MRGPNRPKPKDPPIQQPTQSELGLNESRDNTHSHQRFTSDPQRPTDSSASPPGISSRAADGKRMSLPLISSSLSRPADTSPLPNPTATATTNANPIPTSPSAHTVRRGIRPSPLDLGNSSHLVKPIPGLNAPIKYECEETLPAGNSLQNFHPYPKHAPHLRSASNHESSGYQHQIHRRPLSLGGPGTEGNAYKDEVPLYYPFAAALEQQMNGHGDLMPRIYGRTGNMSKYVNRFKN